MRTSKALMVFALLLLTITSGACVARNVVVRVDPKSKLDKKDGVFYALPRTVVAVAVPVKKVAQNVGDYEAVAKCFFPDDEKADRIVHKKCKSFDLGDPTVSTRGEPDTSEIFMVKIKGHYFEDKNITMALSESGAPTKITAETTNHAVEILAQAADTVTSLILRNVKPLASEAASEEEDDLTKAIRLLDPNCTALKKGLEDLRDAIGEMNKARAELRQAETEWNQAKESKSQTENKVGAAKKEIAQADAEFTKKRDKFTSKQSAFQAKQNEVAALDAKQAKDSGLDTKVGGILGAVKLFIRIQALQAQREAMLVQIPIGSASAEAVRVALEELDKLIAALKGKFLGTRSTEKTWIANFEATPDNNGFGPFRSFDLFRLSANRGVCGQVPLDPSVRFSSLNVPGDFQCKPGERCDNDAERPETETVSVALTRAADQIYSNISTVFDTKPDRGEGGERGFYYRIPAVVTAAIRCDGKTIFQTETKVAQLGLTASLPSSSGGRRTKYELEFYESGAMKNFVLGSDALIQASTVKQLGDAAGNVIDARKEAEKEADKKTAAAKDDAGKVKAQSELLENCKKIRDALMALGKEPILPAICSQ